MCSNKQKLNTWNTLYLHNILWKYFCTLSIASKIFNIKVLYVKICLFQGVLKLCYRIIHHFFCHKFLFRIGNTKIIHMNIFCQWNHGKVESRFKWIGVQFLSVNLTTSKDGPVKSTETRQGWKLKKTTLLQKSHGKERVMQPAYVE